MKILLCVNSPSIISTMSLTVFGMLSLTACQPQTMDADTTPKDNVNDIAVMQMPSLPTSPQLRHVSGNTDVDAMAKHNNLANDSTLGTDALAEKAAAQVVESLSVSQAKFAAKSHDKCPKLLTLEVDSHVITRQQEILKSNHCDYFIYPKKGALMTIQTEPDNIEAFLITPRSHDFANGSYLVTDSGKHVIRLLYTGNHYRHPNKPLDYNIQVSVQ